MCLGNTLTPGTGDEDHDAMRDARDMFRDLGTCTHALKTETLVQMCRPHALPPPPRMLAVLFCVSVQHVTHRTHLEIPQPGTRIPRERRRPISFPGYDVTRASSRGPLHGVAVGRHLAGVVVPVHAPVPFPPHHTLRPIPSLSGLPDRRLRPSTRVLRRPLTSAASSGRRGGVPPGRRRPRRPGRTRTRRGCARRGRGSFRGVPW